MRHFRPGRRALVIAVALLASRPARAVDGHLDPDFGVGGVMALTWDLGGAKNDYVGDIVSDDTALFVAGYGSSITGDDDWEIARIPEDGSSADRAETFFDLGGGKNDHATAIAVDGDQVVVAGTAEAGAGYNVIEVCRYAANDLSIDFAFGSAGCASIDEGSFVSFSVAGIAVASDGGYVIGGTLTGGFNSGFFAAKLTSGGILDTSFGSSGIRVLQPDLVTDGDDFVDSMALARDGGVLLAGAVQGSGGEGSALAKLTSSGAVDTSFGAGTGMVSFTNSFGDGWFSAIDSRVSDTWIDVASIAPSLPPNKGGAGVFELDAVGSPSTMFSRPGWDGTNPNMITRVRYEGDGKTFVAGYVDDPTDGAVLAATRLLSAHDGTIDTSGWGINGVLTWSPFGHNFGHGHAPVAATLWGGRLVLAAAIDGSGNEDWIFVRFTNRFAFADGFESGDRRQWNGTTP